MPDMRAEAVELGGQFTAQQRGEDAAKTTGTYKGAEVQVIDQTSLLSDALEELTSELSEETEKDIADREVEDGKKSDSLERVARLREINELLGALGDLHKKDLFRGLKALMKDQDATADQIRERARQQFEEPAHQYALLKSFAEALKQQGAPEEQVAAADEALARLMEDSGASVRAALNIAETAGEFALDQLGDRQSLRDAYRSNVHDYQDMTSVLNDLTERFGEEDLTKAIDFMVKALGADLAAGGPSIDKTKLNLIVNDMHRLESLTTVLGNCDILVERAHESGASKRFTAASLLRDLIPLQEARWIKAEQIAALPQRAGLREIEPQINFLNDLFNVTRMIPLKSYAKEENRRKLLDAVQQALDEAIAFEAQEEEEG